MSAALTEDRLELLVVHYSTDAPRSLDRRHTKLPVARGLIRRYVRHLRYWKADTTQEVVELHRRG